MGKLMCKSIRTDFTFTAADYDEIWKWSPTRDIRIKKISITLDIPETVPGTYWLWVSKGAVGMKSPGTSINEEEQIIFVGHARCGGDATAGVSASCNHWIVEFAPDYIEVKEGQSLYLMGRASSGDIAGIALAIYYE